MILLRCYSLSQKKFSSRRGDFENQKYAVKGKFRKKRKQISKYY
jgi:hypothetical protein